MEKLSLLLPLLRELGRGAYLAVRKRPYLLSLALLIPFGLHIHSLKKSLSQAKLELAQRPKIEYRDRVIVRRGPEKVVEKIVERNLPTGEKIKETERTKTLDSSERVKQRQLAQEPSSTTKPLGQWLFGLEKPSGHGWGVVGGFSFWHSGLDLTVGYGKYSRFDPPNYKLGITWHF